MKIHYYGHSCFSVENDGWRVIFDPYAPGSVPGLRDMKAEADEVFCSHDHRDHNGKKCVSIRKHEAERPYSVDRIRTAHDHDNGRKRGDNYVTILQWNGLKVAHLGDLGCIPDGKTMESLNGADVVMFPVGGYYTISAEEAMELCSAIGPKTAIPMHYRTQFSGYPVLESIDQIEKKYGFRQGNGCTLDVDSHSNNEIIILCESNEEMK